MAVMKQTWLLLLITIGLDFNINGITPLIAGESFTWLIKKSWQSELLSDCELKTEGQQVAFVAISSA